MADFKYLQKQEKVIEKKMSELEDKTRDLLHESKMKKLKEKYDALLKKKKSNELDLEDEILLNIYKDAIQLEKKEYKK
jgi:RNA polymerase-interacting CarD/CdnL/TRCF family regulator